MNDAPRPAVAHAPPLALTAHWVRFTVRVESEIRFNGFKGSALRGALTGALTRQYCPEWQGGTPDPLHRQLCPVCQLLGWEHADIEGGDIRRPYALIPPPDATTVYPAGASFSFILTLLGQRLHLLPYLILGVAAMGEGGVGRADAHGQRGRFAVDAVDALHPLTGATRALVTAGTAGRGASVELTTLPVTHEHVVAAADALATQLDPARGLALRFITPLRLNQEQRLVKAPAFFPLIKQVALRLLDLCAQHGAGRPPVRLKEELYPAADRVTLVRDATQWQELTGFSQRVGHVQQMGGLVGEAVYVAPDWHTLLPWLVWGQVVQVGKNTVKGCGVYTVAPAEQVMPGMKGK
jgi:hypothetical protein